MATRSVKFVSEVDDFVRQTKERMRAVFHESTQRVISEMQTPVAKGGNMPVDTGFLRSSLQVTKGGPLPLNRSNPGGTFEYNPGLASLVIGTAEIGEKLYASYTANYANHVHYGTSSQEGRQWVTLAAQRWAGIVAQVCVEVRQRVEGSGASS